MRIRNLEFWLALFVIALITILYLGVVSISEVPPASGLLGHSLGVVGFVLMLMTEVLYSIRKRYQFARWGKMKNWLSFHIFTGLVGPYMVLLHSSWKFNGLAGILMLMTVIIVISGFIGRYFYTTVPRSVDGVELELEQLQQRSEKNQLKLMELQQTEPDLYYQVEDLISNQSKITGSQIRSRGQWMKIADNLGAEDRQMLEELLQVWERQGKIDRQIGQISTARKLLAVWHSVHVPLGVALFTVAFIHIGATLYYATLLR